MFGLAAVDISTGAFRVTEVAEASLGAEVSRIDPSEIVAPEALCALPRQARLFADLGIPLTPLGRDIGEAQNAARRLKDYFKLATLDGLGTFSAVECAAAAVAIFYVERTQMAARPALDLPVRLTRTQRMEIDAATRANLELTRTLSGQREGSLLASIDLTLTSAGSRLLAERLAAPLTDPAAIDTRLDAVEFFVNADAFRAEIRAQLKAVPDLARALSRLALERGGPRDLASLCGGLEAAQMLAQKVFAKPDLPSELATAAQACAALDRKLAATLADALADALPLQRRDGNFIRAGYDAALDEQRALRDESRRVIAALQQRYCELAETKQLKLKHNHFLGFFIEVPRAQGETLLQPPFNATFVHRQTMPDAMRFSTTELATLEAKIAAAADEALAVEIRIFDRLAALVLAAEQRSSKQQRRLLRSTLHRRWPNLRGRKIGRAPWLKPRRLS